MQHNKQYLKLQQLYRDSCWIGRDAAATGDDNGVTITIIKSIIYMRMLPHIESMYSEEWRNQNTVNIVYI